MKPRVEYIDLAHNPEVGRSALLYTKEHPRVNGWIRTSKVEKITLNAAWPTIETKNTIYVPAKTDESNPYEMEKEHADSISNCAE